MAGVAAKIHTGWAGNANRRWAYVGVLAIAVVSVALSPALAQNPASPEGRSIDRPGQITAALGLFALLYAVIQGPESGWGSPQIVIAFVLAAVFLVLFVFAEGRVAEPPLLLSAFKNRAFAANSVVTVIGMFGSLAIMYSTSIRLTTIQGFSPFPRIRARRRGRSRGGGGCRTRTRSPRRRRRGSSRSRRATRSSVR
ncbi:hypothetical protein ACH4U3_44745 [Streptomyces griseoruber]|uniref:hypothetical protein n=1 Tax=Streptomyces griseoruber TaxID=1943 RepID=UPI0037B91EA4